MRKPFHANVQGVTTTYEFPFAPSQTKTINLADAVAQSAAVGIDLGAGRDVAYSEGEFHVSANAETTAKAISDFDLFGETDADADAIAKASAWGIKAGSAGDQVFNRNLIQVNASAEATSVAQGSKWGARTIRQLFTKDSNEGSNTFVDASLYRQKAKPRRILLEKWVRFLTGENEDFFTRIVGFDPSTGTIIILDNLPGDLKAAVLDDDGTVTSPAMHIPSLPQGTGNSASVASAVATGIDVGDGNAVVKIRGNPSEGFREDRYNGQHLRRAGDRAGQLLCRGPGHPHGHRGRSDPERGRHRCRVRGGLNDIGGERNGDGDCNRH